MPRHPNNVHCQVPGYHNGAARGHTHCRSHRGSLPHKLKNNYRKNKYRYSHQQRLVVTHFHVRLNTDASGERMLHGVNPNVRFQWPLHKSG